jgi:hypothetical protein
VDQVEKVIAKYPAQEATLRKQIANLRKAEERSQAKYQDAVVIHRQSIDQTEQFAALWAISGVGQSLAEFARASLGVDPLDKILMDTAVVSIQTKANRVFAELELDELTQIPASPASVAGAVPVMEIPQLVPIGSK